MSVNDWWNFVSGSGFHEDGDPTSDELRRPEPFDWEAWKRECCQTVVLNAVTKANALRAGRVLVPVWGGALDGAELVTIGQLKAGDVMSGSAGHYRVVELRHGLRYEPIPPRS